MESTIESIKELSRAKREAHKAFDGLWRRLAEERATVDPSWSTPRRRRQIPYAMRQAAYAWLSAAMDLPLEDTHISMFDVQQCRRVVELCQPLLREIPERQQQLY
jgi:hypothetical protein